MLAWLALLFLLVVEAIGLKWWLTAQMNRLFFHEWAATLYAAVLEVDIIIAWLISMLYQPDGTPGLKLILILGLIMAVIVMLATLFLHWVVRLDMTDINEKDKRQ